MVSYERATMISLPLDIQEVQALLEGRKIWAITRLKLFLQEGLSGCDFFRLHNSECECKSYFCVPLNIYAYQGIHCEPGL